MQIRFRCKSYCVERKIEPTPGLAYCLKYRVKLTWRLHVTGQEDRRLQLSRERLDVGLGLVVTIGNGEIGAESTECLCAPISDRVFIGDAENDTLLAAKGLLRDLNHAYFSMVEAR